MRLTGLSAANEKCDLLMIHLLLSDCLPSLPSFGGLVYLTRTKGGSCLQLF